MEKFRKLGIIEPVLKSLQDQKFEMPTEIQEQAIPLVLQGKDVVAKAATGSGKTLVFASGIIQTAERGKGIQALVLAPTRELAEQIAVTFRGFSKYKELKITAIYGGVDISPQIHKLREADVVIGTPGRILDHIDRRTIDLSSIKVLVLDEADRMLDMGFKEDVERVIDKCSRQRQTLFFSATITRDIARLAQHHMRSPTEISVKSYVDPSKLNQTYYDVEDNMKFSLLVHLLKAEKAQLVMVFCNTQRNTDFVANNLRDTGIDALAIHGGYSQNKRSRTMEKFNAGQFAVLVCTDVAARGLDIKGISHVYNYDLPKDDKEYIHRIGRTARAGKEGKVINILGRRDYDNFGRVMDNRDLKTSITRSEVPEIERVFIRYKDNRSRGYGDRGRFHSGSRFSRGGSRHGSYGSRNSYHSRSRDSGDSESSESRSSRYGGHSRRRY